MPIISPTICKISILLFMALNCLLSSQTWSQVKEDSSKLQILNGSTMEIQVVWDHDPDRRPVATIRPGRSEVIRTSIGHTHLLLNSAGKQLAEVKCRLRVQAYRFEKLEQVDLAKVASSFPTEKVLEISNKMNVPDYYAKIVFANGYPIVGSHRVDDHALLEAAYLINQLLAKRPDVREAMIGSGSRMCIMSEDEFTTELPEFTWLGRRSPVQGIEGRDYWDARARGLGGSDTDPYCSCGEENLLNFPGDPYSTENILIHEFAHNIHLRGLSNIDPTFDQRLRKSYRSAMDSGLWKGKYASVNHHEYFAEGVQSWFNNNRENDHDHNHVNTRQELKDYDPQLSELCEEVFGETDFRYLKTGLRLKDHLADYEPDPKIKFQWPKRLEVAKQRIVEQARERDRKAHSADR